ncbi:MAG: SCO family protein [Bryobacteraceae bacterium]
MKSASVFMLLALAVSLSAKEATRPKYLKGVGIEQKLNSQVPLNSEFRDSFGRTVRLGQYLGKRPAVLALVYYTCPGLCDQILHGMATSLRKIPLRPGRDFDIIAISINPREGPPLAAEKRREVVHEYSPNASLKGWHFLTGNEQNIRAVTNAVGFHYHYDPKSKMFFHGAGIMVLTPQGKAARYLYGVYFEPLDLKLSLVEASHEKIGSPVDQILLYCCHYDPLTGKYTSIVLGLLWYAAALTLVLLVGWLLYLWRREIFPHRFQSKESREVQDT